MNSFKIKSALLIFSVSFFCKCEDTICSSVDAQNQMDIIEIQNYVNKINQEKQSLIDQQQANYTQYSDVFECKYENDIIPILETGKDNVKFPAKCTVKDAEFFNKQKEFSLMKRDPILSPDFKEECECIGVVGAGEYFKSAEFIVNAYGDFEALGADRYFRIVSCYIKIETQTTPLQDGDVVDIVYIYSGEGILKITLFSVLFIIFLLFI